MQFEWLALNAPPPPDADTASGAIARGCGRECTEAEVELVELDRDSSIETEEEEVVPEDADMDVGGRECAFIESEL